MTFRAQIKPAVTFESIAFADIVINLFVFFFLCFGLAASFDTGKNVFLPIALPAGGETANRPQPDPLTVTITKNGKLLIGSKAVPRAFLTQAVDHELKKTRSRHVVVRPDRALTLETFVPFLDSLRRSRAAAVSIAAEMPEPPQTYSAPSGS